MRMVVASALMSLITYGSVLLFQLQSSDMSFFSTFPKFGVICAVSFTAYVGISKLLKISEADPVISRAKAVLFGKK